MAEFLRVILFSLVALGQNFLPLETYTEGAVGQPVSFNPLRAGTNEIDRDISRLLFRGLARYDIRGDLKPDLAVSWTISPNGREYTFKLKENIFWHDGVQFTANDVLYTVSQAPQLREIPTDKLDKFTVRFRLKEPLASFLDILTLGIVPFHLGGRMEDLSPVGTGSFRLIRVKKSDKIDQVILQGAGRRLVFSFYNNREDLLSAAKLGEIDGFWSEFLAEGERWPNFEYYKIPLKNRAYALFFSSAKENVSDKALRQSLALATPKEKIVREVFKEAAEIVEGPQDDSFAESPSYKKYLYTEAQDKNYKISLTLKIPHRREHQEIASLLRESWGRLGVEIQVVEVPSEKMLEEVIAPKNFEILLLGQEVGRDPDRYTLWHSTQKDLPGLNFVGLKNVRIDRSLEEGRLAGVREERIEHYWRFQEVFAEEVPAIFLYRPVITYAVKKKIVPTALSSAFSLQDRLADFSSWEFR